VIFWDLGTAATAEGVWDRGSAGTVEKGKGIEESPYFLSLEEKGDAKITPGKVVCPTQGTRAKIGEKNARK